MKCLLLFVVFAFSVELFAGRASLSQKLLGRAKQGLATVAAVGIFAVSPSAVMADGHGGGKEKVVTKQKAPPEYLSRIFSGSYAPFRSVLVLQPDFPFDMLVEHSIYIGQNKNDEAVFVAARGVVDLLRANGAMTGVAAVAGDGTFTLRSWDGIMETEVVVEQTHYYPMPDKFPYGFTLVEISGLDMGGFTPVRLANFPSTGTPLNHITFIADERWGMTHLVADAVEPEELDAVDVDVAEDPDFLEGVEFEEGKLPFQRERPPIEMSSYWQRCRATGFDSVARIGTSDTCAPHPEITMEGSVIFDSLSGEAVGFFFYGIRVEKDGVNHDKPRLGVVSEVYAFPQEMLNYVEANFTVSPRNKLPTAWGELKRD